MWVVDFGVIQVERSWQTLDRKSTRLNSSHGYISYAVFCLKKTMGSVASTGGHVTGGSPGGPPPLTHSTAPPLTTRTQAPTWRHPSVHAPTPRRARSTQPS